MAVINMGVDFASAQSEAEAALAPAPAGLYEIQCTDYELGTTQKGQPRIKWTVNIVNSPDSNANGKRISHFTNLPHNGDMTGVGFLTQFLNAMGKPWQGAEFDPDTVKGSTCQANIGISKDGKWNEIISFA